MPTADDLFRPTAPAGGKAGGSDGAPAEGKPQVRAVPDAVAEVEPATTEKSEKAGASGRIRHDEKMTVYVTADELMAIERARLTLRGDHRLAVDRGRLVREALTLVLEDLDERGAASMLVQRLAE